MRRSWFCYLLPCVLVVGCGRFDASVTGTVMYDGGPLDHGMVTFYPTAGGPAAYGEIQSGGRYRLRTANTSGIAAGDYRVTVNCVKKIPSELEGYPPNFRAIIPVKYKSASLSNLQFEVEKGKNQIDIGLSSE